METVLVEDSFDSFRFNEITSLGFDMTGRKANIQGGHIVTDERYENVLSVSSMVDGAKVTHREIPGSVYPLRQCSAVSDAQDVPE